MRVRLFAAHAKRILELKKGILKNLNVPLVSIPNALHVGEKLGIDSSGYILSTAQST